ncbi:hypothetical protein ACFHYQ_04695 [Sphaerimonospora cavernae]|uniref:Transposase n=1 Tax=Sphaerimonospora cavernae TaxID=1740611 RepID=A0ABV6TZG1_9ACTN
MSEQPVSPSAPSMEEFARQMAALRQDVAEVRAANTRLRELLAEREAELAVARERIVRQTEVITAQAEEIKQLRELIAELQRRLNIDSNRSGTPTSSEKVWERKERAEDKKNASPGSRGVYGPKRPPGGQRGRKGTRMEVTAGPDRIQILSAPDRCGGCDAEFGHGADAGFVRAQVTELPQVMPETIEYRMPVRRCSCGHATTAATPEGVQPGQACYGPNVKTAVALAGNTAYIYGMHDGKVVWYGAGATRGHATIKGFGLLTGFTGILVRDDYVGYYCPGQPAGRGANLPGPRRT